ncbi:MAG: hypothetical protein ACP5G1_02690 [Nanopusillaceae archaeon]
MELDKILGNIYNSFSRIKESLENNFNLYDKKSRFYSGISKRFYTINRSTERFLCHVDRIFKETELKYISKVLQREPLSVPIVFAGLYLLYYTNPEAFYAVNTGLATFITANAIHYMISKTKPIPAEHIPIDYKYLVFKPLEIYKSGKNPGLRAGLLDINGQVIGEYILEFEKSGNLNKKVLDSGIEILPYMKKVAELFDRWGYDKYNTTSVLFALENKNIFTSPCNSKRLIIKDNDNWSYIILPSLRIPQITYGFETGKFEVIKPSRSNELIEDEVIQKLMILRVMALDITNNLYGPVVVKVDMDDNTYHLPVFFSNVGFKPCSMTIK